MKIAILIYSLGGGGAERVVSQLLSHLKEKNIEVVLVLMNDTKVYEIPDNISIYNIENSKAEEHGFFKFIKLPILAFRYNRLLNKEKIHLSLSFLTRPNYINVLANIFNFERKVIISERSNPNIQYGGNSPHAIINTFLIKKLFSKSDGIIINSEDNRKELINKFNVTPAKTITIYNPLDIEAIRNVPPISDFYNPDFYNFISVGRINKGKNHEFLIRSLSASKNEEVRLYIFGEGHLFKYLEDLIVMLNLENQVFLHGFKVNIFSYLKGADAFLFGSNHEGFPNVLIEAMACGLPIISSNCASGPSEIMCASGQNNSYGNIETPFGILVPINDVFYMAKAINEMVNNRDYFELCKKNVINRSHDFRKENIFQKYDSYLWK